jgi:nitrous oxidase accessory protein NosD
MVQRVSPFSEGKYGWDFGESGWNSGMDENLLKFSFLFDGNVDSVVSTLPAATNGASVYLTTDNRLYFSIGTTWYSSPMPKWGYITIKSTGALHQFDGTTLNVVDSNSVLQADLASVELTLASLGTAAYKNVEDFATSAELDVVSAQANAYTDTLGSNIQNQSDSLKGASLVGYSGRTVRDRLGEVVYEKDEGVLRDGVTDDTASLQSAINKAASLGKVLISGPGTSIVTGLSVPSNLEWLCVGSKLLLAPNTDASILVNSDVAGGNSNTTIKGLELDGNKTNQGAISRPVALFKNCDNFTLERVVAHDAKITSYTVDTYDQILFVDCNGCTVERCESYNSTQGGLGFYGAGGGHRVLFNYVHDCPAGIEGSYQSDSHVFGNKVRNTQVGLISWSGLRNIIYKNDVAVSTGGAGIVCGHSGTPAQAADDSYVTDNIIEDIYSYGVTTFSSAGVTIQGNKIKRASGNYSHSIFINTGCSDVKVKDNRIVDYFTSAAGACGVFVDGCADAEIKDNTVLGATGGTTGNGIRLFNNCPNSEISGNKVVDTVSTGINISEGSTDVTVGMNKVRSSGGVGIRSLGLGAVVSGNLVSATSGVQGILIGADQATVTGNRVTGVTGGSGIFINAVDYNAVVGNILDNCSIGINVPSGSDYNVEAANVMTSTVTTKINIGTTTGNKMAHNIGVATHDV